MIKVKSAIIYIPKEFEKRTKEIEDYLFNKLGFEIEYVKVVYEDREMLRVVDEEMYNTLFEIRKDILEYELNPLWW